MKYIVGCGGNTFNPRTHETKAGRFLSSMPDLQRESPGNQAYPEKHCLKEHNTTQNKTNQKTHKKIKYSHLRSFCEVPLLTSKIGIME